ncbi:hypothetical protein V8C42DRAFT_133283 [Trichoderma barbatum]
MPSRHLTHPTPCATTQPQDIARSRGLRKTLAPQPNTRAGFPLSSAWIQAHRPSNKPLHSLYSHYTRPFRCIVSYFRFQVHIPSRSWGEPHGAGLYRWLLGRTLRTAATMTGSTTSRMQTKRRPRHFTYTTNCYTCSRRFITSALTNCVPIYSTSLEALNKKEENTSKHQKIPKTINDPCGRQYSCFKRPFPRRKEKIYAHDLYLRLPGLDSKQLSAFHRDLPDRDTRCQAEPTKPKVGLCALVASHVAA